MNHSTWAAQRRARESVFVERYMAGEGLDIGKSEERLLPHTSLFPNITRLHWWDSALGGVTHMQNLNDASLDFIHAGFCLADEVNPAQALARWLELLKPGGYAIVSVPGEDRADAPQPHRSRFTMGKPAETPPNSFDVLDIVQTLAGMAECERIVLFRDDAEGNLQGDAPGVIEIVLRKRAVLSADRYKDDILRARTADDAVRVSREALRTYPYRMDVFHHAHQTLLAWQQMHESDAVVAQAAARLFNVHVAKLTEVLHVIARGRLQEGFRMREKLVAPMGDARRTKALPPVTYPAWRGEPLDGKSIVIWSEFGLGDEIFFFRFARILRERCGAREVSVLCQSPLVDLFETSGEAHAVFDVRQAGTMPEHDYWVYPHAIPAHLPLELDTLPPSVPYLRASPGALPEAARDDALKVGFVYKGDPTHENDRQRSAPSLSIFDGMFALEGMQFFSVQKGAGAEEVAAYAARLPNFFDMGATLTSMSQTASVIAALDVIVAVDTSVAHLAAAMGKPVLMILPFTNDWRWHYVREDSPWYPTMHLIRREFLREWDEAVARVCTDLERLRDARRR